MNVMPTMDSNMTGLHIMKKYIEKSRKLNLVLDADDFGIFFFKEEIDAYMDILPNTKEITLRPFRTKNFLEYFFYQGKEKLKEYLDQVKELSEQYKIQINIVFSVTMNTMIYKNLFLFKLKELLDYIQGYKINLLLENSIYIEETKCSVLEICKFFGNKQLRARLNMTYIQKRASFNNQSLEEYAEIYFPNIDIQKYVHEICFQKKHENKEKLIEDIKVLEKYHLEEKNMVFEFEKDEIQNRKEQTFEIDLIWE